MRRVLLFSMLGLALPLTVILLSQDLRAEDDPQAVAVEKLIADLSADDFRTRESASKALAAMGDKARPALEQAVKDAKSPELRWRAEQILRRLRGADQEKPLGGESSPQSPQPGSQPGVTGGSETRGEHFREAIKKFEKLFENWRTSRRRGSPFSMRLGSRRVVVPGIVLERSARGPVTLRVERKNEQGAKVEDVYTGHSLSDILANNPALNESAGMAELKRREAETNWPGLEEFRKQLGGARVNPFSGGGMNIAISSGVEIRQDADGVTVKIREHDEDGKETTKEYKAKSIEELKQKHPELKDKLGMFSVRVSPPQVFWPGFRPRRLNPLAPPTTRPSTPRARRTTGKSIFGLTLTGVSEALASHLGLSQGKGALVDNVLPGSQAEALGVRRNDVLLKVGGQEVGLSEAADLLRKAGTERASLKVELLRRGKAVTLTR